MKISQKFSLFLGILLVLPFDTLANVEVFQVISFTWDNQTKQLIPVSHGSGTAVEKNVILTNKHVISTKTGTADFVLLCQGQNKKNQAITCKIPAAVTAVHSTMDAALIRPLNLQTFFPKVKTKAPTIRSRDQVLIKGYPIPDNRFSNFGNTQTNEAIENWVKNGGNLNFRGDKLTITRGRVTQIALKKSNQAKYFITNAKVNFGNSGGSAIDKFENFIGIPSLKDQA